MESIYHIVGERKLTRREELAEDRALRAFRAEQIGKAASYHLPKLPNIPDAIFLRPQDAEYEDYLPLHNKRNDLAPALRIVCTSTKAVSESIKWVSSHNLPLALRCGGHCFEGFSQSNGVVIDVRRMGLISVNAAQNTVAVSAGADLGNVYRKVSASGHCFAAGSCPTVGITGHTLGGGAGLLGRRFGLACDNIKEIRFVDAMGATWNIDANSHPDQFWAARGGGGGSFGVVTRFVFHIHKLAHVHTFGVTWEFTNTAKNLKKAWEVFDAWQKWAPEAPQSITAIMKLQKVSGGKLRLRCIGQTTGPEADLRKELSTHLIVHNPTSALKIKKRTWIKAVEYFGGSFDYQSVFMEGKSDVVEKPLSAAAVKVLFTSILAIPVANIVAICDAYGGTIANLTVDDTAFPHRGQRTWSIQYYSQWQKKSQTSVRLARNAQVYAAMRPFMDGTAYVNYPDIDVHNFADSYWGKNLPRLKQIKKTVDPNNFFRHDQSIPLP